jgi:predicted nucleotide-binding protein
MNLVDQGQRETAVPRDSVVFEAGYFIGLKGKRNVLIIRESGFKLPADLGGDIYALLSDKRTSLQSRELSPLLWRPSDGARRMGFFEAIESQTVSPQLQWA